MLAKIIVKLFINTTDEKNLIVATLTQIYNNIISDESLEQKIEKLNIIYTTSVRSLNLLIRECAIYSAITQYKNAKYSIYNSKYLLMLIF